MRKEFCQGNLLKSVCLEEQYRDRDKITVDVGEINCENKM
jgi:hypothetical protein